MVQNCTRISRIDCVRMRAMVVHLSPQTRIDINGHGNLFRFHLFDICISRTRYLDIQLDSDTGCNLICQGAKSDKSPDQEATTAAHSANNIIISSHHQVTRSRSIMNVKLTSFSLSRCKMIVHSKSRPGPGSETSFITGAGSEHRWPPSPVLTALPILCPYSAILCQALRGSQNNKQKTK